MKRTQRINIISVGMKFNVLFIKLGFAIQIRNPTNFGIQIRNPFFNSAHCNHIVSKNRRATAN